MLAWACGFLAQRYAERGPAGFEEHAVGCSDVADEGEFGDFCGGHQPGRVGQKRERNIVLCSPLLVGAGDPVAHSVGGAAMSTSGTQQEQASTSGM